MTAQTTSKFAFTGADGARLAGRIDRPKGPVRAWALFAHCFSCSKDVHAARRVCQQLAAQGFGVLRFDFTGLGHSEGDFANTDFSGNVEDLLQAARAMEEAGTPIELLIGHSLGGAAVLVAAGRLPSVRGVATIAAPSDAAHVTHNFLEAVPEIEARGEAQVRLAGRPFTIKKQFLDDIAEQNVRAATADLRRPLLILHAPLDETVGVDHATQLFLAAKHPKSFIGLDGADHLLTDKHQGETAGEIIAAWAARYVPDHRPAPPKPLGGPNGVVVTEVGVEDYTQFIVARDHVLLADEPASLGGVDAGATPYELLNAALGACTSITVRMYAQRKNWPLEQVRVSLNHEKIHAEDCQECEEKEGMVDLITRTIAMEGPLDDAQRAKLLEIADKCPIHRTLHTGVTVRTTPETEPAA